MRRTPARLLPVLAALAACAPLLAATYRIPSDDLLVGKTDLIVRGRVVGMASVANRDGGIDTEITVVVDRVLKGSLATTDLVVRQPGGVLGERAEVYPGIGTFSPGEDVLLMLDRRPGGPYRLTDFALGKFTRMTASDGTSIYRRDGLTDALVLPDPTAPAIGSTGTPPADPDRDSASFERHIVSVVAGAPTPSDYERSIDPDAKPAGGGIRAQFALLGTPPSRWTELAAGSSITYKDSSKGDTGSNCPTGCHTQVAAGVQAWNNAPGASISVLYGGTDSTIGSHCQSALTNQIQFNDPCDEITNLSSCAGTLALGGFSSTTAAAGNACAAKGGVALDKITKGRILVNNGVGSCLNACDYQDMIAHETGHTIGADHSSDPNALMAPVIRGGRCGALQSDDVAFADCLYPSGPVPLSCNITAFPPSGTQPLTVLFGSGRAGGAAPFAFSWDFGDGGASSLDGPTHLYSNPGIFDVTLLVTDSGANTCSDSATVTVSPCSPPIVTSVTPKFVNGILKAVVLGSGFKKGSVVQIDSGGGFVAAPKTVFRRRTKVVGKDVAAIWPAGISVNVRVVSPAGCPSGAVAVTR